MLESTAEKEEHVSSKQVSPPFVAFQTPSASCAHVLPSVVVVRFLHASLRVARPRGPEAVLDLNRHLHDSVFAGVVEGSKGNRLTDRVYNILTASLGA